MPDVSNIPVEGDINLDSLRNLEDAALFFLYLSDSVGAVPDTNEVVSRMDLNFDGTVDTLDVEYFLFFLLYRHDPLEAAPDSLPLMSAKAVDLACSWLHKMEPDYPPWVGVPPNRFYNEDEPNIMARLAAEVSSLPVVRPDRCDLNADGEVNIADAIKLILMGLEKDPAADWDGDGQFMVNDVVLFIMVLRQGR